MTLCSLHCCFLFQLYKENSLCLLGDEFSNLETFTRLLKLSKCRLNLHKCFQTLEEHGAGVAKTLTSTYVHNAKKYSGHSCSKSRLAIIDTGLRLGSFLTDAAWFEKAEKILFVCKEVCESLEPTTPNKILLLQCCHKLLRVQALFCNLVGAQKTYEQTLTLIDDLKAINQAPHLAGIYADFSFYFFTKNEFHEAHRHSIAALKELRPVKNSRGSRQSAVPAKTVVEVLRHASKSCVVKREFTKAGILVRQAVNLAAEVFGTDHPKYADALLDYGFFLLYYDSIQQCVEVYETAYNIKTSVFKKDNVHVALALEDLAYGLYVREYSSGRFQMAKEKSEESIRIMEKLLPVDHFMLSSAKRVKALILEEIAIDNSVEQSHFGLLHDAEELHLIALNISKKAFGEKNVQTAKHYGNLGRLYQSMKKYGEAEKMHLKAIAIKEELLGPDDYEVGLSVGHLASLYNYHMNEFGKAIDLYLRSMSINIKLFGKGYSGLEYDYRGMIHVFTHLDDPQKVAEYSYLLNSWKVLREYQLWKNNTDAIMTHEPPSPIGQILLAVLDNSADQQPAVSAAS
ncbi:hypothetical protein RUM44_007632 [Polyplax serrata]|uniref:Amyloid protein-binding protein 2 n=1 Tax=Polyplax serrata TaxID=468196 RepID=A0ABR1B701_POLSC